MPDTFTNWLKFTPANQVGYRRAYIDLPAFSYTGISWAGASECVAQFNFSASQNFILLNRPTKPVGVNYGLCIRYRTGETVTRYKLWGDTNFMLNDDGAPIYVGQLIKKNFVLEIWSLNGQTTATQSSAIRMFSSVRSVPTDITISTDYALAVGAEFTALANTNTYSIPSGLTHRWNANDVLIGDVTSWIDSVAGKELTVEPLMTAPPKVAADANWLRGYVNFVNGAFSVLYGELPDITDFVKGSMYVVGEMSIDPLSEVDNISLSVGGVDYYRFSNNLTINKFRVGASLLLSNIDPTTARVFRNYFVGSSMGKQVDDTDLATQVAVVAIASPLTLYLGRSDETDVHGAFKLADLLFFKDKILSADEDLQLRQYLNNYHFGAIALPLTFNNDGAWLDNP